MVRPRLGESETKRLQLVITENEISAVDDWRFANRVESRSEAIRRLVQIGLRADARSLDILEAARGSLEAAKDMWTKIQEQSENVASSDDDVVHISASEFSRLLRLAFEAQQAAGGLVADNLAFHPSASAMNELDKAIVTRDEYRRLVYERGDREHEE